MFKKLTTLTLIAAIAAGAVVFIAPNQAHAASTQASKTSENDLENDEQSICVHCAAG